LTELQIAIPGFTGSEFFVDDLDVRAWLATTGGAAKEVIQVQGFDGIVGADAMGAGQFTETSRVFGLGSRVPTVQVGSADEIIVKRGWDDVVAGGHSE
jgi:hypothetical protein